MPKPTKEEKKKALSLLSDMVAAKSPVVKTIWPVMNHLRTKDKKKGIKREDTDYLYDLYLKATAMAETYHDVLTAITLFGE